MCRYNPEVLQRNLFKEILEKKSALIPKVIYWKF